MNFNGVAIVYVKRSACRIHFWSYTKSDAISIMNNYNVVDKKGVLYLFFTIYKEWVRKLIIKETQMWY